MLAAQMDLVSADPINRRLEEERRAVMNRIGLLTAVEMAFRDPLTTHERWIPTFMGDVNGNGPFRLEQGSMFDPNGNVIASGNFLSFHDGWVILDRQSRSIQKQFRDTNALSTTGYDVRIRTGTIEQDGPRRIFVSDMAYGDGASVKMGYLTLERLLNEHAFDMNSFMLSQMEAAALDALKAQIKKKGGQIAAGLFTAALTAYKLDREQQAAAQIQSDLTHLHDISRLGDFYASFMLHAVFVYEVDSNGNMINDFRMPTFASPYTQFSLQALNELSDFDLSWQDFMGDRDAAFNAYRITTRPLGATNVFNNLAESLREVRANAPAPYATPGEVPSSAPGTSTPDKDTQMV